MKKLTFLSVSAIMFCMIAGHAQTAIKMINSSSTSTTLEFIPAAYSLKEVTTPSGIANMVMLDKGSFSLEAGNPDLQKLNASVIIPDHAEMEATIVSSNYYDVPGIVVAPSKGNLKRNISPSDVSYTYGAAYSQNAFFPAAQVNLNTPYILRDYRGQAISVCPFQYNPQTNILRVYTSIVVTISVKNQFGGANEFDRVSGDLTIDKEFDAIYSRQFMNYSNSSRMFVPVSENGCMLVICHTAFAADIQPFVTWKNQKGIATELVLTSTTGTTATAVKAYITSYYATHPTLKYVLLIGDNAQVSASSTPNGDSDNHYGFLSGTDSYPEVFIGRFSATTSTHVQTMVNRTVNYEKTPQASATWYKKGIAIASDQGPGDDGEMDFQHQRNLKAQLMAYTYNNYSENFDGSQGGLDAAGNPPASSIATQINNGAGIITYTGHGSDFAFSSSGFSTTNITNDLSNTTMHPFVWSVACVNGNFVTNATCFAEGWLRAGTPAAPEGALATLMSTINQSWNPPMEGQDAMVNILVESAAGNIKRTFGGLSLNGCMQMNDAYGVAGAEMTDTWNLFGDPSVMVFTNTPAPMVTSHVSSVGAGTTSVTVNCNTDGALICLSTNGVILGTGTASGGSVAITISPAIAGSVILVTGTAYNKMPYTGTINVGSVGIDQNISSASFQTFPNPAGSSLTLSITLNVQEKINISLFNSLGQKVMTICDQETVNGSIQKVIDISALSEGVYFCKMESATGMQMQRIVVQK